MRPRRENPEELVVSRFVPDEPDQQRIVPNQLEAMIRAIAELGGCYPDVVQALAQAKAQGALSSRFEVDALPEPGRTYEPEDRPLAAQASTEPENAPPRQGLLGRSWPKILHP